MKAKGRFGSLVIALLLMVSLQPFTIHADKEVSDWLSSKPQISDQYEYTDALPYSINGNRDCIKQKVITRPAKLLPYWPYSQTEESHESCIVNTGYGAVSQSGYLQTPGESTFGRVVHSWGGSMILLAAPRSPNAIYIEPNPSNGVRLNLIKDFLSYISGATQANGEILYTVKTEAPVMRLLGNNGKPLGVQLDSLSFSSNGMWIVADIPFLGLSRIDMNLFNVKTFDTSFSYNIGDTPGVQSAVTSKGRYVAIASSSFTHFRLYDLQDCPKANSCKFVDLQKYFMGEMPGFVGVSRLRFASDYSLRMFMVRQVGASRKVFRQTLRAEGHPAVNFGYLGLGDSFASGEGAYQYKAITDTGLNKCHLSLRAYPYLISDELGINEAESVACSGAIIEDVLTERVDYRGQVTDKIRKEDRQNIDQIINSFWPGFVSQNEFWEKYEPEIATISIGGNDVGFSDKILACLMPGTCYNSYEDRLEIAQDINDQFDRLVSLYADIKEQMLGKKVYVIGYPEVAMDGGNCGPNVRLDGEEVRFSNQLVRQLNKVIKSAADKAGFFYVDVEQAFYGHRLCETVHPNEAMNGITGGDDIINLPFTDFGGPVGNESFHPNDMGHRKFSETILNKTNNFTAPMPVPKTTAAPPAVTSSMELLKDMRKSGRATNNVSYLDDMLESDNVEREQSVNGSIQQMVSGFKPDSTVEVWMYSDPIKLGSYTTDDKGNLHFSATIPQTTPFGFHTIHVYGTTLSGKSVDIQKVLYVAQKPPAPVVQPPTQTDALEPESDEEAVVSSTTPKPPENNTETEAGNEKVAAASTSADESSPPQARTAVGAPARGPFHSPEPPYNNSAPRVAGASATQQPLAAYEHAVPMSRTYWPYFLAFLPLAAIFTIITVRRK